MHDVTEPLTLEVDQIYHLACPASPPHYQFNPVKTIKTSTMGTLNMLGLAVSKHERTHISVNSATKSAFVCFLRFVLYFVLPW